MKNMLKRAVETRNLPEIRSALIQMIQKGAGRTGYLNEITGTIEKTPGLFVRDDGKVYASSAKEMTPELIAELENDISDNFSVNKFRLLTEVSAIKSKDPLFYSRHHNTTPQPERPDATDCVDVEIVEEEIEVSDNSALVELLINEQQAEEAGLKETVYPTSSKAASIGGKFGYLLLLAGIAAAIVALSIPVRFLLGVSIGVIMLGAALVYASIYRPTATASNAAQS